MRIYTKHFSLKMIFLLSASVLVFTNFQNPSIISQTKSGQKIPDKMKNKTENLNDFKWKKRIVLLKESDDAGIKQLRETAEKIKDRDIIWFRLKNGEIKTNFDGELSENFADYLENEYFKKFEVNVFLIGKDGGIKSKDKELNLKNYFGQIDSMPMRQREMQENN